MRYVDRKYSFFYIGVILWLFISPLAMQAQPWITHPSNVAKANFQDAQQEFREYWQDKTPAKCTGWKQFKRLEWFWEKRLFPDNVFPDFHKIYIDYQNYREKNINKNSPLDNNLYKWTALGPFVKPKQHPDYSPAGLGRTNCISFHPTNKNIIWTGASFGGVWKTTNGGGAWQTFPFTEFLSIGISDIAVAPSNPSVVYAATGDADAAGFLGVLYNYSIGIVKTTDDGATWKLTKPLYGQNLEIANKLLINRILVHPLNENIIYAGTSAGLYKSIDGGESWKLLSALYCRDLEFNSSDPEKIIGAFREVSENKYIFSIAFVNPETGELAKKVLFNDVVRIALAVSKADANTVYAIAAGNDMGFHSFLRSTDGGESWETRARKGTHPNYLHYYTSGSGAGGQGLYDLAIVVDPKNPNNVFIAGVNVWKTGNGGSSFDLVTDWQGWTAPWIHADIHSLKYSPDGALYACTDGGVNKTTNSGKNWTDLSNSLAITQFYKIDQYPGDESFIIGGTQDNGTHIKNGSSWSNILGGDGMDCKIDYTNKQYLYASMYYGSFWRSTNGGTSFFYMLDDRTTGETGAWVSPIAMDPKDPAVMYVGLVNLWKTTTRGAQWEKIAFPSSNYKIDCIALTEADASTIYASSMNMLAVTHDGGKNWTILFRAGAAISDIEADPKNKDRCWITLSGYKNSYKVMEVNGIKVTDISGSLPSVPANAITYQKNSPDRLYIGTDIGVFYKDNTLNDWIQMDNGLPNVVVTDLHIHYGTGKLRAATYARGLWETKVNNCNIAKPEIAIIGDTEFCQGGSCVLTAPDGYVSYEWNNGKTTKSITVNQRGTYFVTITDEQGCKASSKDVIINVFSVPEITISTATKYPVCEGEKVRLRATIGFKEYYWSNGATGISTEVSEAGPIAVIGITSNGCSDTSDIFNLYFLPVPAKPDIYLDGPVLKTSSSASAYQWYLNGNPIQGAISNEHKPGSNGKYQVAVFGENGCSTLSDEFSFTTGIDDLSASESFIKTTPNPSDGVFYLEISDNICSDITLEITNLIGNKVFSSIIKNSGHKSQQKLDLRMLPSGVYLAIFNCGGKSFIQKIIIK